jgi:hypothetical protein
MKFDKYTKFGEWKSYEFEAAFAPEKVDIQKRKKTKTLYVL